MDFGKVCVEFRAKHNLTQKQMAEIIGVSVTMVTFYETGRYKPYKMKEIKFKIKMKEWEMCKDVQEL
ncbi:MAG: helix-turn-helix transcriptional regulator [Paludibacteraceae bacterium]|nr:helix-turn-helix transcriptional regulator [Paludibacteraceae bacterium]